ncbi:MAG: hypothetical protein ACKOCK_09855 [Chloroflexota bacterium]
MTISDEAFSTRLEINRKAREAFQKQVEERERNMRGLAEATASESSEAIPSSPSDYGTAGLTGLWDQIGIRIPKPLKVTETISTKSVEEMCGEMIEVGLDPDSSLQDLLDVAERFGIGVDLWTSPKRRGNRKYRCVLYVQPGWHLERFVMAEAATAWAAVAAALIIGFEQGNLQWIE